MNGGTIVAESFCVRNSGTFTMNDGAIRGNDSLSVGVVNHGQMYANGGTVKDCAQFVLDNYGTVLVDAQTSGTEFDGDVSNGGPRAATIFGGIFHGTVSNEKDGAISGGTFDGKGHTVKNLFINSGSLQYAGLFGYTKAAALRDLTVSGSVTSTAEDNSAGGIVGMAYGGVIENCGNLCTVIGKHTGGIAGTIQSADDSDGEVIISGCYNTGAITGSAFTGGIVGYGTSPEGNSIYDCYNVGSVELGNVQQDDPAAAAGGIAGQFDLCNVYNCYNTGAVSSSNGRAYGIGSHYNGPPALGNCYYLKGTAADRHSGAAETPAVDFADGTVLTAHNGGTATCTAQASCMACGSGYGTVLGHDFTVRAYDEDEHWVKCSRCDAKRDEDSHDWDSGKITKQPACTNEGQKTSPAPSAARKSRTGSMPTATAGRISGPTTGNTTGMSALTPTAM